MRLALPRRRVTAHRDAATTAGTTGHPLYGLAGGGIANPLSGMGGRADKADQSFFVPTRITSRTALEIAYVQSWAANKFISIPILDMLVRWREFDTEDEGAAAAMREAEKAHKVVKILSRAMRAGRLYGTGLLVMLTVEAPLESPLDLMRVREGDLTNVAAFDRFEATVWEWDRDVFSSTYGEPLIYHVTPRQGSAFEVHRSRVLRFDGIEPLSSSGWDTYDQNWGVSALVPVIVSILQDATLAAGGAHLAQEASVGVMKLRDLRTSLSGDLSPGPGLDEQSAEQMADRINELKSIYRTIFLDADGEEFTRTDVSWTGWPELMDRYARRLAAAADIPETRFWGRSPAGMNSTGDSDMANYALHVAAQQTDLLTDPLMVLDRVLARSMGLMEPPEYRWRSLMDLSDLDQATVGLTRAQAVGAALLQGTISPDEGRTILSGDDLFGDLPGPAPEVEEPPMPELEPSPFPVD